MGEIGFRFGHARSRWIRVLRGFLRGAGVDPDEFLRGIGCLSIRAACFDDTCYLYCASYDAPRVAGPVTIAYWGGPWLAVVKDDTVIPSPHLAEILVEKGRMRVVVATVDEVKKLLYGRTPAGLARRIGKRRDPVAVLDPVDGKPVAIIQGGRNIYNLSDFLHVERRRSTGSPRR